MARRAGVFTALLALAAAQAVDADRAMRDPTVPPISLQVAPPIVTALPGKAAAGTSVAASGPAAPRAAGHPRHILVIDGQRYVIEGGRRRGVGDTLAGARIERIEDSVIWVREAGALRRLPMF
ncbi:MAG: hypothetical protein WA210_20475, partial [Burkholderiaceae bacterium]